MPERPEPTPFNNLYLAAFVTAWARVKLHTVLETLGNRVIYYDTGELFSYSAKVHLNGYIWPIQTMIFTDSVYYLRKKGEPDVLHEPKYPIIGELAREHEDMDIRRFVSIGKISAI